MTLIESNLAARRGWGTWHPQCLCTASCFHCRNREGQGIMDPPTRPTTPHPHPRPPSPGPPYPDHDGALGLYADEAPLFLLQERRKPRHHSLNTDKRPCFSYFLLLLFLLNTTGLSFSQRPEHASWQGGLDADKRPCFCCRNRESEGCDATRDVPRGPRVLEARHVRNARPALHAVREIRGGTGEPETRTVRQALWLRCPVSTKICAKYEQFEV